METRQELILRFMTALAATDYHAKELDYQLDDKAYKLKAELVHLSAEALADVYLSRI